MSTKTYRTRIRNDTIKHMSQNQLQEYATLAGDNGERRDLAFNSFFSRAIGFFENMNQDETVNVEMHDQNSSRNWIEKLTPADMVNLLCKYSETVDDCIISEYRNLDKVSKLKLHAAQN